MTIAKGRQFYIGILRRDGEIVGHEMSFKAKPMNSTQVDTAKPNEKAPETQLPERQDDFQSVFDNFVSVIETYLRFMPITMRMAPHLAKLIGEHEIANFAKTNGVRRDDLSDKESDVYELDERFVREFWPRHERTVSATEGVTLLPQILVVGLISVYDAFLASLLRVVINRHPEIVLTSQKNITFQELLEFPSMEDAKAALIEREIESVIRKSHHEQFDWMQHHLNLKLKENLHVWPAFIELCERRNLFTHTGGVVSGQYIKIGGTHKCAISGIAVGQRLGVDSKYFRSAVETVHEVGLKLCYVLWRKFDNATLEKADAAYNRRCMQLIQTRSYKLAEALLAFGQRVPRVKDETRRMMVVNLANAIRLQNRTTDAQKVLDSEDWSATNDEFRICVASVRGDLEEVLRLMDSLSDRMPAHNYRDWPVFRVTRENSEFLKKFEATFGEPLLSLKQDDSASALTSVDEPATGTRH